MDWLQLSSSLVAIVLLAWAAGKMFPVPSGLTPERIRKNYMRYAPEATPGTPIISKDQQASLLPMKGSCPDIGLITQLGDRVVCRTLSVGTQVSWTSKGDTLTVKHRDFTQPAVALHLTPEALQQSIDLLTKLVDTENKRNSDAA